MTRKYNLYQIDSFTREKFAGNPAGVITNADGLTLDDMQKIARELNNSETAYAGYDRIRQLGVAGKPNEGKDFKYFEKPNEAK